MDVHRSLKRHLYAKQETLDSASNNDFSYRGCLKRAIIYAFTHSVYACVGKTNLKIIFLQTRKKYTVLIYPDRAEVVLANLKVPFYKEGKNVQQQCMKMTLP